MSDTIEQQLREVFTADAERAPHLTGPTADALAVTVVGRVRRARHRRAVALGSGLVVVLAVGGAGLAARTTLAPGAHGTQVAAPARTGPLPGGALGKLRCLSDAGELRERAFALDGTVTAISTAPYGAETGPYRHVVVTLHVNEHFAGAATGDTVRVVLPTPYDASIPTDEQREDPGPRYAVGTRLLVSGDALPDDPSVVGTAWLCGWTAYYDRATATTWREALAPTSS